MKEEGRRKKEEGGLYMWIGTPTQNWRRKMFVGVLKSLFEDKLVVTLKSNLPTVFDIILPQSKL